MESGVATRPITDFPAYMERLDRFVFRSGQLMRPIFEAAKQNKQRIVYAEGEDERVLRAVQTLLDENLCEPTLIGRKDVIVRKIRELGLRLKPDEQLRILDPEHDKDVFEPLLAQYEHLVGRRGVPTDAAARRMLRRPTVAASMMLHAGLVDAAVCGGLGDWWRHITYMMPIIPTRPGVSRIYALSGAHHLGRRAVHGRYARQPRPHRRADRRDDSARRPLRAGFRHRAQGGAAVALRPSAVPPAQAPARCATRWLSFAGRRPTSKPMARCTPMPR